MTLLMLILGAILAYVLIIIICHFLGILFQGFLGIGKTAPKGSRVGDVFPDVLPGSTKHGELGWREGERGRKTTWR